MNAEKKDFANWWLLIIGLLLATIVIFGVFNFISKPAQVLDKITTPENIITSYEDFQEMYNTTQSICVKIQNLETLSDEVSGGFSKQERIINEKNNLVRWVEEYNAKSKMITKNYFKSGDLPHQLNVLTICD